MDYCANKKCKKVMPLDKMKWVRHQNRFHCSEECKKESIIDREKHALEGQAYLNYLYGV